MPFANNCPAVYSESGLISKDDKDDGDVDDDDRNHDNNDANAGGGDDVNDEKYDGDMRQA